MNEIFNAAVGKLSQDMHVTLEDPYWKGDLEAALHGIEFTDEEIDTIKALATATVFSSNDLYEESFSAQLTRAFIDPVGKLNASLRHASLGKLTEQELMETLVRGRKVLKDIIHNYPRILKDDMPGEVKTILDSFRENIIPQMNERIKELSLKTGIDSNSIQFDTTGLDHITALPENLFPSY